MTTPTRTETVSTDMVRAALVKGRHVPALLDLAPPHSTPNDPKSGRSPTEPQRGRR